MATICIVLEDQPGGQVDIQVHCEGMTEGAPATVSQKMAVVPGDATDIEPRTH